MQHAALVLQGLSGLAPGMFVNEEFNRLGKLDGWLTIFCEDSLLANLLLHIRGQIRPEL
jgi:hypothetical protein